MATLIVPSLNGNYVADIEAQASVANKKPYDDCIETRFDTLGNAYSIRVNSFLDRIDKFGKPIVFTCMSKPEGGHFSGKDRRRFEILHQAVKHHVAYFHMDISSYQNPDFKPYARKIDDELCSVTVKPRKILSYHNFKETPDLKQISETLLSYGSDVIKIATKAQIDDDVKRVNAFIDSMDFINQPVIGIAMGELGRSTRVNRKNHLMYACLGKATAPGQLTDDELAKELGRI